MHRTSHRRSRLWLIVLFVATALLTQDARAAGPTAPSGKSTSLVIVTNWGDDTCSLIDIATGKELAKISVGLKPYDVKVDPKGRFAYVTASGADYVSVIDIQAMLERTDLRIRVGEGPRDIELSADGLRAVVANSGDDSVSIVDLSAKRELYRVPVGAIPYGVDLTDNDQTAAVTLWGANKVVLVELGASAGNVVKSFDVGSLPYTVVVPSGGAYAVVSCFGSHQVYVVDLKKSEVLAPVPVGRSPWGLSASVDGKSVIVANFYSGDASILTIKPQAIEELKRITLARVDGQGKTVGARRAKNATFTGDPNVAVITDLGANEVLILDVTSQKVLRTISVGRAPYGVAFVPRVSSIDTTHATGR